MTYGRTLLAALLPLCLVPPVLAAGAGDHSHEIFSAGEPGNPKKPARTVQVVMKEGDGTMLFVPARIEVKRGEQIRFLLRNGGALDHEFMEHDDPNARRLVPSGKNEMVWRFTKVGTFEYGCLIPGHREAGMIGTVVVK